MNILFHEKLVKRGEAVIDIEDRGYQFGDGVYEVIRVYNSRPFAMDEHLARLQASAQKIKMQLPYPLDRLRQLLLELIKTNQLQKGTLYVQMTRGTAPRAHSFPKNENPFIVAYTQEVPRPLDYFSKGIRTITTDDIRWLRCDIKSLNLLGAVLAKQEALENGCQEAILIRDDVVTEGSSTNVFAIKDGILYTHPANHLILNGITRMITLELAKKKEIPVVEKPFTRQELYEAEEVFVTGTTMEISPVIQIDQQTIGKGTPGPLTRTLQELFEQRITTN